jgi:hypothetical protein
MFKYRSKILKILAMAFAITSSIAVSASTFASVRSEHAQSNAGQAVTLRGDVCQATGVPGPRPPPKYEMRLDQGPSTSIAFGGPKGPTPPPK